MEKVLTLLCAIVMLFSLTITCVYADTTEVYDSGESKNLQTDQEKSDEAFGLTEENTDPYKLLGIDEDDVLTTDEINDKISVKGKSLVSIVKRVGEYVCVIAFIVAIIVGITSAIFQGTQVLVKSLIIAVLAGVMYACIVSGEEIMAAIVKFVQM